MNSYIRTNYLKKQHRELTELKYNNSSDEIRRRILTCIAGHDVHFYYILYNTCDARGDFTGLSCKIVSRLLQGILDDDDISPEIYIDRYLNGKQQLTFNNALKQAIGPCMVEHVDSKTNAGIQIADFIAGTLHRYHNVQDTTGNEQYELIQAKLTKIE